MGTTAGVNAAELLKRESSQTYSPIPTFVQSLDKLLGGGIRTGLLTELVGDSGVGKTALCVQLCLNVQIPRRLQGLEGHALFIDTENTFVAKRVEEMARAFVTHVNMVAKQGGLTKKDFKTVDKVMSSIFVMKCKDFMQFEKVILSLEEYIKDNPQTRLIVIDSIAFPFYDKGDSFWERTKPLYSIGQVLHYLAPKYGIAVVVSNKLTTRFNSRGKEYFVPYLGEAWLYVPNQRIQLYWVNPGRGKPVRSRMAEILKSSHCAPGKANFKVTAAGVRE